MYSSRGGSSYGQQAYAGQSGYSQSLGGAYSGSSVGGPDGGGGGSQHSLTSRHSSMLSAAAQGPEVTAAYRSHHSAHYGGAYGSVYGSAGLNSVQQVPPGSAKGSIPVALEGRSAYSSTLPNSPKFASSDYVASSSSHVYAHKSDPLYPDKIPDYPAIDRRQYGDRQSVYLGRDMQSEPAVGYADSPGLSLQQQASLLRQEQLLKARSMQSAPLDVSVRQIDYLAARGAGSRHLSHDIVSFEGRMDTDPHSSSLHGASSYSATPSILGAAPCRSVDDLLHPQSTTNPGYGISLPPGRDYGTGKGLHGSSLELDYRGLLRIEERRDERADYLREFELREEERRQELLRERERDRERERERERDREREWERQRERERERERQRKRERERVLERREKERERERKRGLEIKPEHTPPKVSRDRRGSSLLKEGRSGRPVSPTHEPSHRRLSPVKEKRREYVCKVYTSSLVATERDYLSIDKRYPRLFISPEFSKVIINWPKENLKLSIHNPISFEHDFIGEETASQVRDPASNPPAQQLTKSNHGSTVWNAKIILMSGLSRTALEELSSEKSSDERLPHICNILRFAVLKRDNALIAIGGSWGPADGGDPSVDDSVLIQTALRHVKDITQLDLQRCQNWNRFLEIHYDRFGKDGCFSHKEVTVIFVPNLSECLPSLDAWKEQWVAHKRAVAERERQLSSEKEKTREKKDGQKDKVTDSAKDPKRAEKGEKDDETLSSSIDKKEKVGKDGKVDAQKANASEKEKTETSEASKSIENKEQGENTGAQTVSSPKPGKKKIVRKIVKQKLIDKVADPENTARKLDNLSGDENAKTEFLVEQNKSVDDSSGGKTFVRKKVIKKVSAVKASQKGNNGLQVEGNSGMEIDSIEGKLEDNVNTSGATAVKGSSGKATIKKKIVKRVLKRKLANAMPSGESKKDGSENDKSGIHTEMGKQAAEAENWASGVKTPETPLVSKEKSKSPNAEKHAGVLDSDGSEIRASKDGKELDLKGSTGSKVEHVVDKQKVAQKDNYSGKKVQSKDEDSDRKDESKGKFEKEMKERKKPNDLPRHPGLILHTKSNKEPRLRSLSLSLDSLLDYTDKDIAESTFELSLFAESLYEMLQYQMGTRILTFLQKLRIKFVMKRNQRKRQRDENDKDKKPTTKLLKTNELPVKKDSAKSKISEETKELSDQHQSGDQKEMSKEDASVDPDDEANQEDDTDYEEDPEEDPEECEEEDPGLDLPSENDNTEGKVSLDSENEQMPGDKKYEPEEASVGETDAKDVEMKQKADIDVLEKRDDMAEAGKRESSAVKEEAEVDKELLQAFRFFDRNRTGYIRVEDMRLIIHNLGKFLSRRDVKELVQSALLESNTGRDDHILYNKLVRMTAI